MQCEPLDGGELLMEIDLNRLTGIGKPWKFVNTRYDDDKQEMEMLLEYDERQAPCPKCGPICSFHDRAPERRWQHPAMCLYNAFVVCRVPRTKCTEHGVLTIEPEWAAPRGQFTLMFEAKVIELLQMCQKQERVAKMMGISADSVRTIMKSAVELGLARREAANPKHLAIDEKSYGKGHNYMTVFTNGDSSHVIDVITGRGTEEVVKGIEAILSPKARQGVAITSMDMAASYAKAASVTCPNAKRVVDRYHVSVHVGKAIASARRQGVKELNEAGETEKAKALKGVLPALRYNPANRPAKHQEVFDAALQASETVATVWKHGELLRGFYDRIPKRIAKNYLTRWVDTAQNLKIPSLTHLGNLVERHFHGILDGKLLKCSNAVAESINSKIQEFKTAARGFKSFERYRFNTLFYCGGLDMLPQKTR